jgi:hypothetical protein
MGARVATLVQPRVDSWLGRPALLVAGRPCCAGLPERRAARVAAPFSADPGRPGDRAGDARADRDATVTTLKRQAPSPRGIPATVRVHVRRCDGEPAGADPGPRTPTPLWSPVPVAHGCAPFLRDSLTPAPCRRSPVPVAQRRSLLFVASFRVAAVTSSSCASRAPSAGRFGRAWSPVPVAHRVPPSGLRSSGKGATWSPRRFGTTSRGWRHGLAVEGCAGRVRPLPRWG